MALLALKTAGTQAQTIVAPPESDEAARKEEPEKKLPAVVVTASKLEQNLLDVPVAVSVLDEATLEKSNVREIDDLPALSPALTVTYSTQPANYSINMRGIGTYSFGIGVEADVSVIVDDVPAGYQAGAFKDLADVSRIEVLKGPQSTLYGKSSIAGALNITSRKIAGPMTYKASALVTDDKEWRIKGSASGMVSDRVGVRISALKSDYDGTVRNLSTGKGLNGSGGETVMAKLQWSITGDLDVTLTPRWNKQVKSCCVMPIASMTPGGLFYNVDALPAGVVLKGIDIGPRNVSVRNDFPAGGVSRDAGMGMKIEKELPRGYALMSVTSYDQYHMNDFQDGDGSDVDILSYSRVGGKPSGLHGGLYYDGSFDVKSTTQEFRLTSPDRGPLRFVAGLWYGRNDLRRFFERGPTNGTTIGGTGLTAVTAFGATASNTSYAAFGQSTWDLLDSTSLVTGLRLNREYTSYGFTRYTPPPAPPVRTEYFSDAHRNDDITGRVGVNHRLDRNTMVYGSYSTGHKGVAYDLTSSFTADIAKNQPVPAETAKSWEFGYKASLLDERAALSVALFNTNFFGFQQSAGFTDPDGVFRTTLHSIGQLRTRGIEIDGALRASRDLSFRASLAYTEATIRDFQNGPCYSLPSLTGVGSVRNPGCAANPDFNNSFVQNLAGKTLPNAPKIKVNLGADYDLRLQDQAFDAFISSTYRWQSETRFSLSQDPATVQKPFGIMNLGLGLKDKRNLHRLTFTINNVFDKTYAAGLSNSVSNGIWSPKAPNTPRAVNIVGWTPPRDYKRYASVRFDTTF